MHPRSILDAVRRWLAARPRRLAIVGGVALAAIALAPSALAQPSGAPAPTMVVMPVPTANAAAAAQGTGHDEPMKAPPIAAPTPQPTLPPGAMLPTGKGPTGEEAEGGGEKLAEHRKEVEEHTSPPEDINVKDLALYGQQQQQVKDGARSEAPVVPYIYIAINALILFAIYYYAGRKPVSEGLAARSELVAKELAEAATIKSEAQAKLGEYTDRLDKLDSELDRMKQELVAAGEKDRDRIVKEAEEKAERMRKDADFLLDQELKQLRIDLLRHTVETATAAAEGVLTSKLSTQDHDRVADEYLANLGKLPPAGALGAASGGKTGGAS